MYPMGSTCMQLAGSIEEAGPAARLVGGGSLLKFVAREEGAHYGPQLDYTR